MAIRENLDVWARSPFASQAAMIEAMRDPQYKDPRNDAYRLAVAAKIMISSDTGTSATVYRPAEYESVGDAGIGQSQTEAAGHRAVEQKSAEDLMIELYGPLAVAPRVESKPQSQSDPNAGYGFQNRA